MLFLAWIGTLREEIPQWSRDALFYVPEMEEKGSSGNFNNRPVDSPHFLFDASGLALDH